MDFDEFAKRMVERTNRRKALLQELSPKAPSSTNEEISKPIEQLKEQSIPPPIRSHRQTRLAELASRVDQWLEEDISDRNTKPIGNETTLKMEKDMKKDKQQTPKKSVTFSQAAVTETKPAEINSEESISKENHQLLKPKVTSNRLEKIRQQFSGDKPLSQKESPNHSSTSLTVAQRRALFEKNIAGNQQQNKKPVTTTTVTISLTKTTNENTQVPSEPDNLKTPPRPIPCSTATPPSRRGTRPRISPALAASSSGDYPSPARSTWTPPCIKNVLLKKKLVGELEDDVYISNDNTKSAPATSSPINAVPSPDTIAMSVGHVRIMPPSPSGGLYPDLSLIEDNDNMAEINVCKNSSENLLTGCKRRSNGISASNISTASSESVAGSPDDDSLNTKRPRCESKTLDTDLVDGIVNQDSSEESFSTSAAITTTPGRGTHSLSFGSSHVADSPLSQPCTSFTYHRSDNNCRMSDHNLTNEVGDLSINEPLQHEQHEGLQFNDECFEQFFCQVNEHSDDKDVNISYHDDLNKQRTSDKPYNNHISTPLVHTVSTYRKQQQLLRSGGTSSQERCHEQNKYAGCMALRKRLQQLDDDDENEDSEEENSQELEMVELRARQLEKIEVPQQECIIEQATQALNLCYSSRNPISQRPMVDSKFEYEYVHTERILLLAGLRRMDAVREAQRLHVERTLLPGGKSLRNLKNRGDGKTLVIESLRVPILMALTSGGNYKNKKYSTNDKIENMTRWPGGYRYFVCAIRAVATVQRPPVTIVTQPVDVIEESVRRFSADFTASRRSDNELNYGYVDFMTKKPIMVHGLDEDGWKITIELYGLSSTNTKGLDNQNGSRNIKENECQDNSKSVLDKLWSTVTTPIKDSKKHTVSTVTSIESPGGSMAVRNTVFRQLGYFVFSDGQVNRQQFTLNKVHQSGGVASISRAATNTATEEIVRVNMKLLGEGEQYICKDDEDGMNFEKSSSNGNQVLMTRKQLKLPSECKRTEGFLTLFDDHELRNTTTIFERGRQWQHRSDIGSMSSGGTTSWRRLWFQVEIIDDPEKSETSEDDGNHSFKQKTIVLRYWKYPEHAEQQREPIGAVNLGHCLPSSSASGQQQQPIPAAPALPDLCARPNTLRLILYNDDYCDGKKDNVDDPLLLSADTADERREWCEMINESVRAIKEYCEQIKVSKDNQLKLQQKQKDIGQQQSHLQEQQRSVAWPTTPRGKNHSKKKKF